MIFSALIMCTMLRFLCKLVRGFAAIRLRLGLASEPGFAVKSTRITITGGNIN
jgi:hypothetical protein